MGTAYEHFVDRQEPLEFCMAAIHGGPGSDILLIQGPDGIGKSALLGQLARACQAEGIRCARVDFASRGEYSRYPNFLSALTDLWSQLELGTLAELGRLVTALYPERGSLPAAGLTGSQAAGTTTPQMASASPGQASRVQGSIDHLASGAQAAIGSHIVQVQGTFYQTVRQDDASIIEPLIRANLTAAFQERLKRLCAGQRVVILLDSWEAVRTEQGHLKDPGAWLSDQVLALLPPDDIPNCVAVIACADEPGLGALMRHVRRVALGPLPAAVVTDYFRSTLEFALDDAALTQLTEISQGIPLAMTLLADGANTRRLALTAAAQPDGRSENVDAVIGDALDRYLESLSVDAARGIRIGAVVHRADRMLLAELGLSPAIMEEIERCSFVLWDAERTTMTYHAVVRRHFLAWWHSQDAQAYRQLNRRALDYFTQRAGVAAAQGEHTYEYEREIVYHSLIDDEATGFERLVDKLEQAFDDWAVDQAQGFVDQGVELERRGLLSEAGRDWLDYARARLSLLRQPGDAGEAVFVRLAGPASSPFLRNLATWNLGNVRVEQHRWSEAVRLYRASLSALQRLKRPSYVIRIMLALGNAYLDLAQSSGGLPQGPPPRFGSITNLLYALQQLPFLAYEQLVRRNRFLPNWYFGTNYQDWIVAYLLVEATKWYRKAETEQTKTARGHWFQTQLDLAEIDHRLNRWSRARHRYASLMERTVSQTTEDSYQRAQVALGRGRTLLEERQYAAAENDLQAALDRFVHFGDQRSAGRAAALLGRLYAAQNQTENALTAYRQSLAAFQDLGDSLAATRVAAFVEDLAEQPGLRGDLAAEAGQLAGQITVRQYLVRFPDQLLRWFRRLALVGALPLTLGLGFVFSLALFVPIQLIEAIPQLDMFQGVTTTTLIDLLTVAIFAVLPLLLILWLHRLAYTLSGLAVVHALGRRLSPIERQQPRLITCSETGVTLEDGGEARRSTIAWTDAASFISMHCRLRQRPLELVSSSLLTSQSGAAMVFEGVTSGYDYLLRDIQRRLCRVQPALQKTGRDFIAFSGRWILVTTLVVALVTVLARGSPFSGAVTDTGERQSPSAQFGPRDDGTPSPEESSAQTPLTALYLRVVPAWLLLGVTIASWRLLAYQRRLRSLLPARAAPLSAWALGLGAAVLTLVALLWFVFLLTARASGS